jgi:hypothetical protein
MCCDPKLTVRNYQDYYGVGQAQACRYRSNDRLSLGISEAAIIRLSHFRKLYGEAAAGEMADKVEETIS